MVVNFVTFAHDKSLDSLTVTSQATSWSYSNCIAVSMQPPACKQSLAVNFVQMCFTSKTSRWMVFNVVTFAHHKSLNSLSFTSQADYITHETTVYWECHKSSHCLVAARIVLNFRVTAIVYRALPIATLCSKLQVNTLRFNNASVYGVLTGGILQQWMSGDSIFFP